MCRSVPQMPTRLTRSKAWPGAGVGVATVPVVNVLAP